MICLKKFISIRKNKSNINWVLYSIIIILVIIILNIIIGKLNINSISRIIINNSYGNILDSYKVNYFHNLFINNILGFNLKEDKESMKDNNNIKELIVNDEPLVYIYNTFQTMKYKENYYNSYTINPVITRASLILKEYLNNKGINSIVETKKVVEELSKMDTEYYLSYQGSKKLMEEAKNNNYTLKYFFDIQLRDGDNYNTTTFKYKDKSYAKIMFVIGTDNVKYRENQKLAMKLNERLNSLDINLGGEISLRGGNGYQGYYNEDFNENTLLIKVGGPENTIDEVNRSLKILANVIAEVIYEEEKK